MHKREDMLKYQNAAASFVKQTKRCALFIDMGLGKTVSVLTAVRDLQADLDVGRVLVCGPPRVARKTWPDEIRGWEHTRRMSYTMLTGTPAQRAKNLNKATDIHLISHDLLPWLDVQTLGNAGGVYDMIVVDESSAFKSQKAKRWKALRRLCQQARYVVLLTGTPVGNGLHNLWAQIYLIDQGERLGPSESAFKDRYFDEGHGDNAKLIAKDKASENIRKRIDDVCFTLLDTDYADLPPRVDNMVKVELLEDQRKAYKKFVREAVLELGEEKIKAISAGALTQKLQQFSNGIILKDGERRFIHRHKMDALHEIVEESNGQPIIVIYSHQADRDAIMQEFPYAKLLGNNPATQDEWNAGRIQMLVTHPKSVGHGLNLQHGGNILVWYGLTWSLELYKQTNKRLHRKGQTKTVVVHHIITEGTIDTRVMASLKDNNQTEQDFLHGLRRIILDEYREAA